MTNQAAQHEHPWAENAEGRCVLCGVRAATDRLESHMRAMAAYIEKYAHGDEAVTSASESTERAHMPERVVWVCDECGAEQGSSPGTCPNCGSRSASEVRLPGESTGSTRTCDCGCHKTGHERAIPHKGPWKCCEQAVMADDDAETPDALREEVERLLDAIADLGIDTVNGPWENDEMGDCGRAASAVRAILQAGDKASVETEAQR